MNENKFPPPANPVTVSRRSLLSLAAAAALLQACGGGGGGGGSGSGSAPAGAQDGGAGPGVAPTITVQPADASVAAGMPATFTVAADGSAPLAYQWLRDGAPIPGANGSTYTLSFPLPGDSGARFSVVVANGAGSITSNAATLTVSRGAGVSLLAGGLGAPGNADGTGTNARFNDPRCVAVDGAGNVYIADAGNHTVRRMTPAGVVTTFAGQPGKLGHADGPGSSALFFQPCGVCVDAAGMVYVTESGGMVVRRITPDGVVSTFAGQFDNGSWTDGTGAAAQFLQPGAITSDAAGNLYVADTGNNRIRKITPAGAVSTLAGSSAGSADGTGAAAQFWRPAGIVYDPATDALYVGDTSNNRIRKVTLAGVVTTVAGSGAAAGTDATGTAADFNAPCQLCVVGDTLFVADRQNNSVRAVVLSSGAVTTFAGRNPLAGVTDGTGTSARFQKPWGLGADAAGNLFVSDSESCLVRKVTPARVVTTVAGGYFQQGSTDGAGATARFNGPSAIARDAAGNLYVADMSNSVIRKVTADGVVTTLAGTPGAFGNVDGTGAAARFSSPGGILVDATGTVYVADTSNHSIRKITPSGVVTTLCGGYGSSDGTGTAGKFNSPAHMAFDPAGNIIVADAYNHAIRQVTPAGVVTTIAGTMGAPGYVNATGTAARFYIPRAVAVDAAGVIYVADGNNNAIRQIDAGGAVSTFAGSAPGPGGAAGDAGSADGTGTAARFAYPSGITVDGAGNLYVADAINATLRKLTPAAVVTTPFGQAGRTGVQAGTPGAFSRPVDVVASADGRQLWVADSAESSVLVVTQA